MPKKDSKQPFSNLNRQVFDQNNSFAYLKNYKKGLNEELIAKISATKKEAKWVTDFRLQALEIFRHKKMPGFGPDLSKLNLNEITYFALATKGQFDSWEKVPAEIKRTFERLGIPQAERQFLAGVGSQYESEVIYHRLKEKWSAQGVIFEDLDVAFKKHEELVRAYFMQLVPANDHKFAALHGAVFSGGTFLYVPKGVRITEPLQAYFRMNAPGMGQFEHTLIIIDEGAEAHYIEGCSAPKYGKEALHAGCVEIYLKKGARFRYSSVENWSKDTYNLNTKRAKVESEALIEWVGGNMGSGVTMLYPCSILAGEKARADHLGIAFANSGQIQDTGAKVIHAASNTSSKVVMKSLSKGGGKSIYRGLIRILEKAKNCTADVKCDALILDQESTSETIPEIKVDNASSLVTHEATAGKINEEDIFYLESRGLSKEEARAMIVNGFIDPIIKALPLEYAVEMNRLMEMEMEEKR